MDTPISLEHERVDDIPVILGLARQLDLAAVIDQALGRHGNHQGLSPGGLASVWIAYILSEADHRKSAVEDWADQRRHCLSRLTGQPLRRVDFSDDRLGRLLRRLAEPDAWQAIEAALWRQSVLVYQLQPTAVRLDATTSYGYHAVAPDGLMRLGHSKDHRPDLPQLKLMAAAAEPTGQVIACDVHPGHSADDPLYTPLIQRVRSILDQTGLLYIGDSKMAARQTRAELARAGDYYLMPAPDTGELAQLRPGWINDLLTGRMPSTYVPWGDDEQSPGGEISRTQRVEGPNDPLTWTERVLVVQSSALAQRHAGQLEERLRSATSALLALTPEPGRGRPQHRDAAAFLLAVKAIEARQRVEGLLTVEAADVPDPTSANPTRRRFVVRQVRRSEDAIAAHKARLGWSVLLTNLPAASHSLAEVVGLYAGGWLIEHDFHLMKDRPLGIQPLYVQGEAQIRGLTHLLTLALRLLTLVQARVRASLAAAGAELAGLFPGQPTRSTPAPTGRRLLAAFARAEVTLTRVAVGGEVHWHVTGLSDLLRSILAHAGLSHMLYEEIASGSS
jgi:transposase